MPGGKLEKFRSVYDGFDSFLFTPNTTSQSGVHIHDSNDSKRTMIIVVLALMPALLLHPLKSANMKSKKGSWFQAF